MSYLIPFLKNVRPLQALFSGLDISERPELQGTAKGMWIDPSTLISLINGWQLANVITSYSIHYTKLYECSGKIKNKPAGLRTGFE